MKFRATPLVFAAAIFATASAYASDKPQQLGDLSSFKAIAVDTLKLVDQGDMKVAEKRITDFETAWDKAEPTLRPKDKYHWGEIDDAADSAIKSLRDKAPNQTTAHETVKVLIATLK